VKRELGQVRYQKRASITLKYCHIVRHCPPTSRFTSHLPASILNGGSDVTPPLQHSQCLSIALCLQRYNKLTVLVHSSMTKQMTA